jgi:hypothetical protein
MGLFVMHPLVMGPSVGVTISTETVRHSYFRPSVFPYRANLDDLTFGKNSRVEECLWHLVQVFPRRGDNWCNTFRRSAT